MFRVKERFKVAAESKNVPAELENVAAELVKVAMGVVIVRGSKTLKLELFNNNILIISKSSPYFLQVNRMESVFLVASLLKEVFRFG